MAADVINEAHDLLVDPPEQMPTSDIVEVAGFKQLNAVMSLNKLVQELRHDLPTRQVRMGEDVTIHQPFAMPGKEWQVVIEAPKPKDVPTQEEFDKVRSEVDGGYIGGEKPTAAPPVCPRCGKSINRVKNTCTTRMTVASAAPKR